MADSNIEAIYRLSPVQEGMLFHTLESAKSGVYFEQYSCLLSGPLDYLLLKTAWQTVLERHPTLRTLFTWERRDQPVQIVRQSVVLPWSQMDWSALSEDEQQNRWKALLQRDRDRGFDLEQAPLLRLTLVQQAPRRTRLLWSFHHLLLDGWSMLLILDEVMFYYRGAVSDRAVELPAPPPYVNFVRWLEQRDRSGEPAFWSGILAGYTKQARIQPDCVRGEKQDRRTEFTGLDLAVDRSLQLESFAKRQQITLNTLVVGAWAIVLGRYCKRRDVIFGTTVSGRSSELERSDSIAGLFLNTLPFRAKLAEQMPVGAWLRDIQSQFLKMREFEHTPLTAIQRWSELPAGTGLFDTILVYEGFPPGNTPATADTELLVSDESYIEYSHYPLSIKVFPGKSIELIAVHDTQFYSVSFAQTLLEQLQTVLLEIASRSEQPMDALALSSKAERYRLLEEWNHTQANDPEAVSIHQLIEKVVESSPDALAVVCESEQLSYRTLNNRANKLAGYLRECGVQNQIAVPVLLNRSGDAIVAILAVLKSGSAYIPLDPIFAEGRIGAVYDDLLNASNCGEEAGRRLLAISRSDFIDRLPADQFQTVCLDRDESQIAYSSDSNPEVPLTTEKLAYIMYTSGSTGRPKGVMISHASLLNSTRARSDYYQERFDRFMLLSSLATDSSVAGIFWSLSEGATLVLPRDRIEQDIYGLVDSLYRHKISHLLCLPSLYQLILEHTESAQLECLKLVIVAGEACRRDVLSAHRRHLPRTPLHNEYGPSEACVWASVARLDQLLDHQRISIGRPINNQKIFILDEQQRLVPIGVAGELCISGVGLAVGYLNQVEKTASSFISHPFDTRSDARLYRSGDLARYLPDGDIEFLGRFDNQVKIRGFRVELQEVEEVLLCHSDVNESVVVLEDGSRSKGDAQSLLNDLTNLERPIAEQLLSSIEELDETQVSAALENIQSGEQSL